VFSCKAVIVGILVQCCAASLSGAASAAVLISEEEAKLPPPKGAVAIDRRGVSRAPKVILMSNTEPTHSPMHLQLKFESFGGTKIDEGSVKVTFLRTPNVDLTPRVKSSVQSTGIDMPEAELPAGDYMLRVDVKDTDGHVGSTSFMLQVEP
jgi:methionine-rich copper-binding protein CopC